MKKKNHSVVPDMLGKLYSTSSTHQRAGLSKEMKILIYSMQHAMHPLPSFIPSQPLFLQYSHFSSPSNFTSSPSPMPT
jgi:hypothetical protein